MFTGLSMLISSLAGLFGGSVPRFFDLFDKKMNFAQEVKIRELEAKFREQEYAQQLRLAEANISGKIEESLLEATKAEILANAQTLAEVIKVQAEPTGYAMIDAVNASIRPLFFLTTIILFFIVIAQYAFTSPAALEAQAATQFWVAVEATIGWIAGYRSAVAKLRG